MYVNVWNIRYMIVHVVDIYMYVCLYWLEWACGDDLYPVWRLAGKGRH